MAVVMSLSPGISNLCDDVQSTAQITPGSNGWSEGDPEYSAGPDTDDMTDGRTMWDDDLSDGFDTQAQAVQISASAADTTLWIDNVGSVTSADAPVSRISEVDLRACTQSPGAEAKWSNIVVQFYKGGKLVETVNVGTLDAKGTDDTMTEEDLARIVPSAADDDAVVITGVVELSCDQPYGVPTPTTLFCQSVIKG